MQISGVISTLTYLIAVLFLAVFSTGAKMAHSDLEKQLNDLNREVSKLNLDGEDDYIDEQIQQQQDIMKLIFENVDRG